jgi:hypothetical protein
MRLNVEAINKMSGFNKIYSVSYLWSATIGIIVTILVGLVVSLATKSRKLERNNQKFMLFKSSCSQSNDEIWEVNVPSESTKL